MKLNILWTTDNKQTVINMLALYAYNSLKNRWWNEVSVIVWGASAKLIADDKEIQEVIKTMQSAGVTIEACKVCSDNLNVTETLINLDIDVKYMGDPLTTYLKSDAKLLTI